uniref:Cytochrome P450 n=1 Tax=Ditylenchus dipsaci TaxID=166011 RepID=A0A915DP64_9BILA
MASLLCTSKAALLVLMANILVLLVDKTMADISSLVSTQMPFYLFRPQQNFVDQHPHLKTSSDWVNILSSFPTKEKRVHNLALLRFTNKLAHQNAFLEGRLRDKRVHSLSLLRFNGRNPMAMSTKLQRQNERSKRSSPSKRMHHLSLLRTNGKLFYNPSSESSEQQKRFDIQAKLHNMKMRTEESVAARNKYVLQTGGGQPNLSSGASWITTMESTFGSFASLRVPQVALKLLYCSIDDATKNDVIAACSIFLAIFYAWNYFYILRQFPPGPRPFPIIGNFMQIDTANPHRSMITWRKKYGPVFTIWIPKPVVVFASFDELHGQGYDGASINYHKDDLMRRLADSQPILGVHNPLAFCFGNIIHDLVLGHHYTYENPTFWRFKHHIDCILKEVASGQMLIVDSFPWIRFIFPAYYRYLKHGCELQKFFQEEIDKHITRLDGISAEESTNFIDAYLIRIRKLNNGAPISYAQRFTLAVDTGDLWTGGMETVVTTLTWAVLYLIHYPEVQEKSQRELDEQLAGEPFAMNDRLKLPYMCATIDELQRIVNVLPWNIPHANTKELNIAGKVIPAGTNIMPQIGAVLYDEELFPSPDTFMPERFLVENNSNYNPSKYLKPFGMGKRKCIGESLAKMELNTVFASLIQNFHFEAVHPEHLPSLSRLPGMASRAKNFECRIKQRRAQLVVSDVFHDKNHSA